MRKALIVMIMLPCLVAVGCGKKNTDIVGKWSGSLKLSEKDQKNPALTENAKKMGKSSIEFKADHTFTLTPIEGTWTLDKTNVSLVATKISGQTIAQLKEKYGSMPGSTEVLKELDKPMKMKMNEEGTSLTLESQNKMSTSSLVFTRDTGESK